MARTVKKEMILLQALERRFLYKIKFEKPDASVRGKIWQQMIPDLSDKDAQELAGKFDFSGGQIENVVRKYSINSILHGDTGKPLEILLGFGKEEQLDTPQRHKIGF